MGKQALYTGTSAFPWRDPSGDLWSVDLVWAEIDGRAECVGLAFQSYGGTFLDYGEAEPLRPLSDEDEVHPVRAGLLRAFTMSLIDEARGERARDLAELPDDSLPRQRRDEKLAAFTENGRGRRLVGRDGQPLPVDEALDEVAAIYRQAWREGGNPTAAVSQAIGISRSAAAKRVRRARDAGLLPETSRGRANAGLVVQVGPTRQAAKVGPTRLRPKLASEEGA
jgi:hypothetical protein